MIVVQRYFSKQKKDNNFILSDNDLHHIKTVMRMKDKDQIEVVYNSELYICELCKDNISIINKEEKDEAVLPNVSLVIPLLKEQKLDLILQKATELGVDTIYITKTERTIVKVDAKLDSKIKRWTAICKEASEQSKRNTIPNIVYLSSLNQTIELDGIKIVCSTQKNVNKFKSFLQSINKYDKLIIVIGPEGGLSLKEEDFLIENGFKQITLGNQILRVETVPISVLSIINYEFME